MTEKGKILGFIGLAKRAGKVVSGTDSVTGALRNGTAKMLILTTDVSENTINRILDNVTYEIPMYRFATMDELGNAVSAPPRGVLAITDEGFATKLDEKLTCYEEDNE